MTAAEKRRKNPVKKMAGSKNLYTSTNGPTIGEYSRGIIVKQPKLDNAEVLRLVLKKFPDASTTKACISWYRSKLNAKRPTKSARRKAA